MKIEKFSEMLKEIEKERGISQEALLDAIRAALLSAAKKRFKDVLEEDLKVDITENGEAKVFDKEEEITPKDFGRIAAQTAKQVIIQRIREAEKNEIYDEYFKKQDDLIVGTIQRKEYDGYLVNIGRAETFLTVQEQIWGEHFRPQEKVRFYVVETKKTPKGPLIIISRSHPGLVKKLFELEVPEIAQGIIEIKAISREGGRRTKIAVHSKDKDIPAVGTCIGPMGNRILNVIKELKNEKIDVIEWNENPKIFISQALNPAKVVTIDINEAEHSAKVVVPESQLSLAIGKDGQNVRLAAKLTGWKIDIISDEDKKGHKEAQGVDEGEKDKG